MGLVFSISNFFITKTSLANKCMRKKKTSSSNLALQSRQTVVSETSRGRASIFDFSWTLLVVPDIEIKLLNYKSYYNCLFFWVLLAPLFRTNCHFHTSESSFDKYSIRWGPGFCEKKSCWVFEYRSWTLLTQTVVSETSLDIEIKVQNYKLFYDCFFWCFLAPLFRTNCHFQTSESSFDKKSIRWGPGFCEK